MNSNLDLSHLTPEEREHLHGVLSRAQQLEEQHGQQSGPNQAPSNVPSHQVFQSTWKDTHGIEVDSYQSGTDIVRAALTGGGQNENAQDPTITPTSEQDKISTKSGNSASNSLQPSPQKSHDGSPKATPVSTENHSQNSSNNSTPIKKVKFVRPTIAVEGRPVSVVSPTSDGDEEKDVLSPLPENTSPKSPKNYDAKSMVSRSSINPHEFVGEVKITLVYYPPGKVQQVDLPMGRETRMHNDDHLDVLTRKTYAALSGSRIRVYKDSRSGAKGDDDGELQMTVHDAFGLRLPSGMSARKAKTYVKCYILPDRYHGSKMRSNVIKDTLSPEYEHKFIFRGFSKSEFQEKSIEVVIGGIVSNHGRHLVVGGIRLSSGNQKSQPIPWKKLNEEELSLWEEAFETPCKEVTVSLPLRPRIKLTYK